MCKQKLCIGLLVSAMYMAQACGMEQSLATLEDRLNKLRDALGEVPPPPPPREEEGEEEEPIGPGFELPPPPPPLAEGEAPKTFGKLPPPPVTGEKPVVKPVTPPVKPEPGTENIPPKEQEPLSFKEMQEKLKGQMGGEPAVKPVIKKTVVEKVVAAVSVPKINISMAAHVNNYMAQLEAKPIETMQQKAEKKAFARGVLNGILAWIEKKKVDAQTIMPSIQKILAIDPLLISTVELILEKQGLSQQEIYGVMTSLYQERINFIGQEIGKIKAGSVYAGIRDDIDEAIAYPIELSGALQHAKNQVTLGGAGQKVAQDFVSRMAELKAELCRHITENIMLFDVMYRDFYRSFCAEGIRPDIVYCITAVRPGENQYVSIGDALKDVVNRIETYKANQSKYWASKKIFELQYIVNTLAGFIDFFTDPKFCKICLTSDVKAMQREQYLYKEELAKIRQFLFTLADQQQNVFLRSVAEQDIPRLERLLEEQKCAVFN